MDRDADGRDDPTGERSATGAETGESRAGTGGSDAEADGSETEDPQPEPDGTETDPDGASDGAGEAGERTGDEDQRSAREPPSRGRSALLWGLVGGLSFLVLHQGYLLLGGRFVGFLPVFAVAVLVAVVAGVTSYYFEGLLAARIEDE